MILLTVDGLTIRYDGTTVVENLSFQLGQGESVGIVGESGSGKTQTALALLGLLGKGRGGSKRRAGGQRQPGDEQ